LRTQNVGIVYAADFTEIEIFIVQQLGDLIDGVIAALPYGLVHLNLQHQVAAASKIKTQADAVRKVSASPARRRWETAAWPAGQQRTK